MYLTFVLLVPPSPVCPCLALRGTYSNVFGIFHFPFDHNVKFQSFVRTSPLSDPEITHTARSKVSIHMTLALRSSTFQSFLLSGQPFSSFRHLVRGKFPLCFALTPGIFVLHVNVVLRKVHRMTQMTLHRSDL